MLIDESNNTVGDFSYMPYGGLVDNLISSNTNYRFTGQEYDTETLLHNFRARMYDSEAAIFYGSDTAQQGFTLYGYVGNNPVMYIDKDGNIGFLAALGAAALMGGAVNAVIYSVTTDNWNWSDFGKSMAIGAGTAAMAFAPAGVVPGMKLAPSEQ